MMDLPENNGHIRSSWRLASDQSQ